MKKFLPLVLLSLFALTQHFASAQCTINTSNTTSGFTPTSLSCITQGTAYGQAVNVHIPATTTYSGLTVNVDSVLLVSVTGLPAGITVQGNPASGIIHGGQNGCLWFSGTTTAAPGTYPLTFNVTIWADYQGIYSSGPVDTTLAGLGYPFSLTVCAGSGPSATISPAGTDSICQGASATLTANSGTGYTYRWSDAAHSTTQSISVSTGGAYKVTVYNNIGDSAVSAATTVVVKQAPGTTITASGNITFCTGDSVRLTAPAGSLYAWSNGANNASIKVTTAGQYTVTVTGPSGCTAASTPVNVVTYPVPVGSISLSGMVLTSQPATTYQWYLGSTPLAGDTSQTLTVTQNGTYSVKVSNTQGCTDMSNAINVTNVGVNNINATAAIHLYPNPNDGLFTLAAAANVGDTYTITDELGRFVQKKTIQTENSLINVSGEPSGVYYLTVKSTNSSQILRFVIMK